MNVLDENVSRIQRQLLHDWDIPIRHIGYEIGRKGMNHERQTHAPDNGMRAAFCEVGWHSWTVASFRAWRVGRGRCATVFPDRRAGRRSP